MLSLQEDIEEEFILFGVQTPIVDETKFIFLMNQHFGWKLVRSQDLDVKYSKETFCFSSYLYEYPHNEEDYVYIIKNLSHDLGAIQEHVSLFDDAAMSKTRSLLDKYSVYQYLIKFPEDVDSTQINKLTLNSIEFIYHIQPINNISRKEKKYFLI